MQLQCTLLVLLYLQVQDTKPLSRKHAVAVDITVTPYHRHHRTSSQITSPIKTLHIIKSRVLSLNVMCASSSRGCWQRDIMSAGRLHYVRLIASVGLRHRHCGMLQWGRRCRGHVHHATAVAIFFNVVMYSQLTQTWSCRVSTCCNNSNRIWQERYLLWWWWWTNILYHGVNSWDCAVQCYG